MTNEVVDINSCRKPPYIPSSSEEGLAFLNTQEDRKDHFISLNNRYFAGFHFIADLWGCTKIDCLKTMEQALREAVVQAKATLLHIHLHHFTPNGGISGVAVLAESHISVHTWPEHGFAAFDVFMCGEAKPSKAIDVFRDTFIPSQVKVSELTRGEVRELL